MARPCSSGTQFDGTGVPGAGKRLFDGFDHDVDLAVVKLVSSPYATHVRYAVTKKADVRNGKVSIRQTGRPVRQHPFRV